MHVEAVHGPSSSMLPCLLHPHHAPPPASTCSRRPRPTLLLQVPNLDAAVSTKASIKQRGVAKSLRMLLAGITDLARTAVGQEPIYLPLAGKDTPQRA